jgi:hypothetical protein
MLVQRRPWSSSEVGLLAALPPQEEDEEDEDLLGVDNDEEDDEEDEEEEKGEKQRLGGGGETLAMQSPEHDDFARFPADLPSAEQPQASTASKTPAPKVAAEPEKQLSKKVGAGDGR